MRGEVIVLGHDHAGGALDGLRQEHRDVLRAQLENHLLKLIRRRQALTASVLRYRVAIGIR